MSHPFEQLRHYSHGAIESVESRVQVFTESRYSKPEGLWVSVDDNGDGWREWCDEEEFDGEWENVYRVRLTPEANVLHLSNADDIDWFTERYARTVNVHDWTEDVIDWPKVAEDFQGLIIAPYVWERRLNPRTSWYYPWDCASGCIWDAEAILGLEEEAIPA